MNDVMIDIETPGTKVGSAILTIGAVKFDRKTGVTIDTFYARIGKQALFYGSSSQSTMDWWGKQSAAAYNEAWDGDEEPHGVARRFAEWLGPKKQCMPWGNGSIFDMSLLEHWFDTMGVPLPWDFWNVRDVRTAVDLLGINPKAFARIGVYHNALDDSLHQIKYLCSGIK